MSTSATVVSAGAPIQLRGRSVQAPSDVVYVYVYLQQGTPITAVDSYLWQVANAEAANGLIAAYVEVSRLAALAAEPAVRTIRQVMPPLVRKVDTTEGDVIHRSSLVRSSFPDSSGSGVKVGVISDGVNSRAAAQLTGDLPADGAGLTVLSNAIGGDEGTAMLEIVYDMVPAANLYFHDAGSNVLAFNAAISSLVTAGCDVIVDDIGWLLEPYFQTGTVGSHVASVLAANDIVYVSSAGNEAQAHHQKVFVDDGGGWHRASPGASAFPYVYAHLPTGGGITVVLQWNEAFGASGQDYDLYLGNLGLTTLYASSTLVQNGNDDPLEYIGVTNNGAALDVAIGIKKFAATGTENVEVFAYPNGGSSMYSDNLTAADSIYGHPAIPGVVAAAAIAANDVGNDTIEPFSSQGPVTLLAGTVQKPDISGIDGVNVTGVGGFSDPFYGTSAAAPHVAAIAAQIWGKDLTLNRNAVVSHLLGTAVDVGTAGYDNVFGAGRADAHNAFTDVVVCTGCTIASVCYANGQINPANSCQVCTTASTTTAWSNVGSGTACGSPSDTACDNPDTCNGSGTCQANNEPSTTNCGDADAACVNQDKCNGSGACTDNGFKANTTACGDQSDTECTNPDRCSGTSAACAARDEIAGTNCGDADAACVNQDTCNGSGACTDNGFKSNATACGSGSDTECDNPDTCSGTSAACLAHNEASGVSCTDGNVCNGAETCNGSGVCSAGTNAGSGTSCGNAADTDCDNPDTCNGLGTCLPNNEASTQVCRGAADACDVAETCGVGNTGACPPDGFAGSGAPCGSSLNTDCDNADTCNGSGTCLANNEPSTTNCGDADGACVNQDKCSGTGTCTDNGFKADTTACGSSSDTECDNPDTCSGTSAACVTHNEPSTTNCGDADGACVNQDKCSGTGTCTDNGFKPNTTVCGDQSDTECTNPDRCSGTSAACAAKDEIAGTNCGDADAACVNQDTCNGSGSCTDNGFKSDTTACGSGSDTECDDPDTCSGTSAACVTHNEPTTTNCGDADGACVNQDKCNGSGSCTDNGFKSDTTACGSGSDTECDNPDTCSGTSATCVIHNEPSTTNCGDAEGACVNQDKCSGTGTCTDNGFKPNTTVCGDQSDTECTNPDRCSGTSAACAAKDEIAGTNCGDADAACVNQDTCNGSGSCTDNGFKADTTACGSSSDVECDNPDTCSGTSAACVAHNEVDGFACAADANDCTDDVCATGVCTHPNKAAGVACGSNANTECDNPDTCNASGSCQDNREVSGTQCRAATGDCDAAETCDGVGINCPSDGVEPITTTCRAAVGDCDVDEHCDGTDKTCPADQFESDGTVCSSGECNVGVCFLPPVVDAGSDAGADAGDAASTIVVDAATGGASASGGGGSVNAGAGGNPAGAGTGGVGGLTSDAGGAVGGTGGNATGGAAASEAGPPQADAGPNPGTATGATDSAGCDCRIPGNNQKTPGSGGTVLALLGLLALRRRRAA